MKLRYFGSRKVHGNRIVLWVSVVAVLVGCPSCRKPAAPVLPPPIVQVMRVTPTNITHSAEFIGQLDSPQTVEVLARVEGFVDNIHFTEGSGVKQGDLLFTLDKRPFEERLAAAKGMLAETRAALQKNQTDVARLTPLEKVSAIPKQDLDNALAAVDMAKANVASADARVKAAELELSYCEVRAPISGLIGAKQVSIGALVGKGQPTLLATVSQLNPIWFYCALSEVEYLRAQRRAIEEGRQLGDLPVTLFLPDGTAHPSQGKWVFLDRAVDITTGTLRARAEFPNEQELLRPGMFSRVRVTLRSEQKGILVPERALVELQGQSFVWVVDEANKASQRPVQVRSQAVAGFVQVVQGLNAGDQLVVEGLQKVKEGAPVNAMTAEQIRAAMAGKAAPPGATGTKQGGQDKE